MVRGLALLVALCALGGCLPTPKPLGTYGAICVWPDSGEKTGTSITLSGSVKRPRVKVTICEGRCANLAGSSVSLVEDRIEFDTPKTEGGPPLHFVGRFDEDVLIVEGRAATTSLGPLRLGLDDREGCPAGTRPA